MFALELKFKLMSCAMFFVCFGLLFSTQEFVYVAGMVCLKKHYLSNEEAVNVCN